MYVGLFIGVGGAVFFSALITERTTLRWPHVETWLAGMMMCGLLPRFSRWVSRELDGSPRCRYPTVAIAGLAIGTVDHLMH